MKEKNEEKRIIFNYVNIMWKNIVQLFWHVSDQVKIVTVIYNNFPD